jgi:hypothetical protein
MSACLSFTAFLSTGSPQFLPGGPALSSKPFRKSGPNVVSVHASGLVPGRAALSPDALDAGAAMRAESPSELERWQAWQARFVSSDRRAAIGVRTLAALVVTALLAWLAFGLLAL